jgi:hypothetical protein
VRHDDEAAPANTSIRRAGITQLVPNAMPIAIAAGTWSQSNAIEARLAFSRMMSKSLQPVAMLKFPMIDY